MQGGEKWKDGRHVFDKAWKQDAVFLGGNWKPINDEHFKGLKVI